jgi:hypothetical protein
VAGKFLRIGTDLIEEAEGVVASTGTPDANRLVSTGANGKIHPSVLPTGVGPDLLVAEATENLAAGSYVNIFNNGGTTGVRLADRTNGRQADGFVKTAVTAGNLAEVFFEGPNDALSGLTIGARYFLSTLGQATATPPTGPGLWQYLGRAISTTAINTDIDDAIERI